MRRKVLAVACAMVAPWAGRASADEPVPTSVSAVAPVGASSGAGPIVFEGFGCDGGGEWNRMAAALGGIVADPAPPPPGLPLDIHVRGPSGRSQSNDPLAAEVQGRIEGIDLSAGLQADPAFVHDGPARWVGGLGLSSDHERGRDSLELKTSLGRDRQAGILGLEFGPRIERRLAGGKVFFLDGKAQAQARRPADGGEWMVPRLAGQTQDGAGMLGVTANTGLLR